MLKPRSAIHNESKGWNKLAFLNRLIYRINHRLRPKLVFTDEYINWLFNINVGMLVEGNVYLLNLAVSSLEEQAAIVEIGSYCGLSTNILTYLKRINGKNNPLFTCDQWIFEEVATNVTVGGSNITHGEYRAFARETYIRNTRMFSRDDLPYTVELSSDDFFSAWQLNAVVEQIYGGWVRLGGPIGLGYIDGNHAYEQVQRDFLHLDEFLQVGGYILFDDSSEGWGWEGVRKVVSEVRKTKRYRLVLKNPNYLFQKLK